MVRYSVAAVLLLAALLMNGCTSTPPGQTDNTYAVNQPIRELSTVKKTAQFALYAAKSQKPIWEGELGPGDEYGFVKRADGMIYGVVKGKDIPLPDFATTSYFWNREDARPSYDD